MSWLSNSPIILLQSVIKSRFHKLSELAIEMDGLDVENLIRLCNGFKSTRDAVVACDCMGFGTRGLHLEVDLLC